MLVLVILGLIWGFVLIPPYLQNRRESRPGDSIASFRQQLHVLERTTPGARSTNLSRLDVGRYPSTEQGLAALWETPMTEPRPNNWRGPYLRKAVPNDPWGNPYVYMSPGENSKQGYDLMSYGADGQPGGEDDDADVTNWN